MSKMAFVPTEYTTQEARDYAAAHDCNGFTVGIPPRMAGQISELARRTLPGDFRNIDPATARVVPKRL